MKKKRYWAFVLYPESAPDNWLEFLQLTGLSIAISPLHDKDINPDGQPKKPHYHIILCYDGPTTYNNVKTNITDVLNQPIPIALEQVKGYYRYLTHLDNPEKYQYNKNDIVVLNNFDISDYELLTNSQVQALKVSILKDIEDLHILEYSDLLSYYRIKEMYNHLDVAMNHTILFNTYLCSKRNSTKF